MEISCGGDREVCNRSLCAVALRRFAAWVKPELQEAVTFCTCKTDDVDCLELQVKKKNLTLEIFSSLI